ncbi:YjcG family protein [Pseudalkalibacillus decolorationis]|uniref:YjcG family protein n=1 Tax=Pseudalkalibacillus decolorationis TaxID=163879 RepID=UPI00214894B6|nr:YjcG family protein [Pseudalkalibacillus decolorationis]
MKYGIVIFPSKKLQDTVNTYRKRYDPHYALIAPHVTLKAPFEVDDEDELKALARRIHEISDNIQPFNIQVYKVGSFHPVNNVIYFRIKDDEKLTELHEKLHENNLYSERSYNFVPHLTLAQKLSDEEHHDVLESLKMMEVDHTEAVDRFQLLYQLENGTWTVFETFHLGKVR